MANKLLAICLMFMVASSVVYEVQGHFLLKLYLKRKLFPRRCIDFTPYACNGMLLLVRNIEGGCPATREFKQFFSSFKAYLSFISSVSVTSSSNIDVQLNGQANSLFKSCKLLQALRGQSSSSSSFETTMMSMGKTLIEQKRSGSVYLSFTQRRELTIAMVQWTRIFLTFVKTASEQSGKSIDISSYGLDVDVNKAVGSGSSPSEDSSSPQSRSSPTPTNSGSYPTPETPATTGSSPTPATPTTTGSSPTPTTPTTSGSIDQSASSTKTRSGSKTRESSGGSAYTDTTGAQSASPSGSPAPTYPSTPSSSSSSKKKESGSSQKTESSGKTYSDTTGPSPTSTPTPSTPTPSTPTPSTPTPSTPTPSTPTPSTPTPSTPTPSTPTPSTPSTETKSKGTGSASSDSKESKSASASQSSQSSTSVKQVETETSSEVMSFISELEKKYTSNAELKVFFEKLKTSMSATSKISTSNSQDLVSGMRAATGRLSEAMMFVRSRFSNSAETKSSMESCQEKVMSSLKDLQEINSEIASKKTVTSTQKTELKQTLTKWEQVTTQFVETAASSSSSSSSQSSSSKQTSGSSQKQQTSAMNSQ